MEKQGTTFDITEEVGTNGDGKKQWKPLGRTFVRVDDSGGGLWESQGEQQKAYFLVPREGTSPSGGKSFSVMEKGSEVPHGVLFIRKARNGGYYRVASGETEKEYAVFVRKPKTAPTREVDAKTAA